MKKVKGSDFFCGELFPESTSVEKTEALPNSYDWGDLFERLSQSRFRSKFRLTTKEIVYLKEKEWIRLPVMPPILFVNDWLRP